MTSLTETFEEKADPARAFLNAGLKHSFDIANHGMLKIVERAVETAAPVTKAPTPTTL